jgi:hypothetical protein
MKTLCECCGDLKSSILYWDRTTGKVCAECRNHLMIAETALKEAGIVGAVIDPPQKQKS